MSAAFDVAIAGLGALGSAAAYHLARRGRRVLGLDRYAPPHAFGSSHGRTRIIREAYFEDPLYVPLVQQAYPLWEDLERRSGRALLRITGALMIGPPDSVLVTGALRSAREHRLAHELLAPADMARRFPAIRPREDMVAVWEPRAGVLFPEACVDAHLALARAHGAELKYDEPLAEWHADGDGVRIVTGNATYRADKLLLAAGAWLGSLVPELALPLAIERQVQYWLAPARTPELFAPERCPVHLWETAPGKFFYGLPDFGDGVKVALHHDGETTAVDRVCRSVCDAEIAAIREHVRMWIPAADGALQSSAVCVYTNTPDDHFWIDTHPRHEQVLIASACSGHGFKFAPALGQALAAWLIDGAPNADLSRFRRR